MNDNTHEQICQADEAERLLLELLASGPMRPRDVRAEAELRGLHIADTAWAIAKKRLHVETMHHHASVWTWALPAADVEDGFVAWLNTPHGKFAVYAAERDRQINTTAEGAQLEL